MSLRLHHWKEGGCLLFMADGAGMNSRTSIRVKEDYERIQTICNADSIR